MAQKHDLGIQKRAKNLTPKLSKSDRLCILMWSQLRDPKQRQRAQERYTKDQFKDLAEYRKKVTHK